MDEKQLQEAIDGMISQRPRLVVERPREVRQGMGLFEASQAVPLEENTRLKVARDVVKRLDKMASQITGMYSEFKSIEGSLFTALTGYGQKEFVEVSDMVRKARADAEALRSKLKAAADRADDGVKSLKGE